MEAIRELVEAEFEKLELDQRERLTPDMKRVMLIATCKTRIFNEWGTGTPDVWTKIEECAKELIPESDQ